MLGGSRQLKPALRQPPDCLQVAFHPVGHAQVSQGLVLDQARRKPVRQCQGLFQVIDRPLPVAIPQQVEAQAKVLARQQ
jgi:hypothetical protein